MSSSNLPIEIRTFIARHIRSVGHLEVVLLLGRDPARPWSADEISRELRTNPVWAESQLRDLLAAGLLQKHPCGEGFYALASSTQVREDVERLRSIYVQRRPSVIAFIYSQPLEKIRDLADAFVIRKE